MGEGGNGISCGAAVPGDHLAGRSGMSDGTGFRFWGVKLFRLGVLGFESDGGISEDATEDGGDTLDCWVQCQ